MKKAILLLTAAAVFSHCGSSDDKKNVSTESKTTETTARVVETPTVENKTAVVPTKQDVEKGQTLITKSDCLTCHKVAEKMIGPSYEDVAKRYAGKAGAEDTLVQKIIKGGSGNWGEIPMPPHTAISAEDASAMVTYILNVNRQ